MRSNLRKKRINLLFILILYLPLMGKNTILKDFPYCLICSIISFFIWFILRFWPELFNGLILQCVTVQLQQNLLPKYVFSVGLQHYSNLFIRVSINNVVKCTKKYSLLPPNNEEDTVIIFDEVKYFSVQVMLNFSSK